MTTSTNSNGVEIITTISVGAMDWQKTSGQALEAIQRVRTLHRLVSEEGAPDYCFECRFWYPCDTIKFLDGEQ